MKPQATGFKRLAFVVLGFLFTGIGLVGIFVPLLPTTPWLLLASWFFARSSPRFHRWLRTWPLTGAIISDWEKHRGVRLKVKIVAVLLLAAVMACSIWFGRLGPGLSILLVCIGAIGATVVVCLPRVKDQPPSSSSPSTAARP
ncbi:MAG: YbaN family protein [Gemmataceae bacterium]|nr:YbaN family protein [Gemmataceae bacterium]